MITDCKGNPYPIYTQGNVEDSVTVKGAIPQGSVFLLKVAVKAGNEPLPGQFLEQEEKY